MDLGGRTYRPPVTLMARAGGERLAVMRWFWVDGRLATSETTAKLYEVLPILRGRPDPVAWILVYTPVGDPRHEPNATLAAFFADMQPALDAMLRQASAP